MIYNQFFKISFLTTIFNNILSQKTLKNSITLIIIITFHTNNLKKLTVYNNTFFMSPINYNISQ